MTAYHVTVIEGKDLQQVTIVCGHCKAKSSFDILGGSHSGHCFSCNKELDKATMNALSALNRFSSSVRDSNSGFEFHLHAVPSHDPAK